MTRLIDAELEPIAVLVQSTEAKASLSTAVSLRRIADYMKPDKAPVTVLPVGRWCEQFSEVMSALHPHLPPGVKSDMVKAMRGAIEQG